MHPSGRDIVVLGGSAGALGATRTLLEALPPNFPAAVLVALHRGTSPDGRDSFASRLARTASFITSLAQDGQRVQRGHAYIAPFDHHLLIENGVIRLQASPKEMFSRPCIDVLFKSAASCYGRRVIGVLLSGSSRDGTAGLWHIKKRGGVAIVQSPSEAQFSKMPGFAIASVSTDFVLPVSDIAGTLEELVASASHDTGIAAARILIVEDESVVATNLQRKLVKMAYDVIDWVPSGEAAIERAAQEHPDLILMDIHLSGAIDGIDAARRIWEQLQIPVVYCTAHSDVETLSAVKAMESYGYVVKPFQSEAVRVAIELALARRGKELR